MEHLDNILEIIEIDGDLISDGECVDLIFEYIMSVRKGNPYLFMDRVRSKFLEQE